MKFFHAFSSIALVALVASAGCSQEGLSDVNTAGMGTGATSGSGMTATGGTGTGGSTGGSATGGTGGSTGGSATGGTGGSTGGSATSGGMGGTGTGGVGGTGTAGMGGSAGIVTTGGSAGTGMAGSGGMPEGGTSAGGMAGTGTAGTGTAGMGAAGSGAGGSSSGPTPEEVVPGLQGFYWEGTCSGNPSVTSSSGHNCPMTGTLTSLPANGIDREQTVPVMGTTGQDYTINIEVRGVVGTRCYTGGTRASSAALSETGNNNWWYIGGTYANPTGWWNTYELHVAPSTGDPSGDVYYFNGSGVQGGSDCEREASYLIKYNASFKAKGGGTLTFKLHDQNGKGQQNCGQNPDQSSTCAPRTVDLSGMVDPPPANFTQPPTNQLEKTYYPQWLMIAVTSVTSP